MPGFTLFPMSQNAHFIMYVSDSCVGAERFLRYKMLTHFDDIPVDRAPAWCCQAGLARYPEYLRDCPVIPAGVKLRKFKSEIYKADAT